MKSVLGDVISRYCFDADHLVIIAPCIKVNALAKILNSAQSFHTLLCITKWNAHDIAVGNSDIECRAIVNDFGGRFKLHPTLHAKYYRMDNVVLVGSANVTLTAMGWAKQPSVEILYRAGTDFDFETFESEVEGDSREIGDEEYYLWESIKSNINKLNSSKNIDFKIENWNPSTRDPTNILLFYKNRIDEIASFDEQKSAQIDIDLLNIPSELSEENLKNWMLTCLISTPFAQSVMSMLDAKSEIASQRLAQSYSLSRTEARRKMETVHNWLALLAPKILTESN